ncbi:MAG TPA: amidohydrolase family protein [Longimicrobiales bacterium]
MHSLLPRARPRSPRRHNAIAALLAVTAVPFAAAAADAQPQPTRPETPPHFAITNARIVPVSGPAIAKGTVVVRNGLIRAVGADVQAPADAWIIDGTGLTVYPGLMDAFTTLGHPERSDGRESASDEEYAWGPEDRKGTFTYLTAADGLDPTDSRVAEWRNAGFTTALATRARGIFPGQAAVIVLAGERGREMVVSPSVAQRVNLSGQGFPGYPGSLLGIFAYIKQLYFDAQHYHRVWTAYEANPRGQPRPEYDPTLEPLRRPAPVLFPAEGRKEILRAIQTGREIGVPIIVYGAQRAYEATDVLSENRIPVLVDLDWPRPPRNPDPELTPTLATLRAWEHAPTTPAKLEAAGVRFAFYTGGLSDPDDARSRIKRAIDAGLSREAALRALTIAPAQIFGVADRLGSIEPGKIANLVITDGDLFEPRTKIRTVVVDGRVFDIFQPSPAVATRASQPADSAAGGPGGQGERADSASAPSGPPVPMAEDRGPYRQDPVTLIRNATILTASHGRIEHGDILIRNGKIAAVGEALDAPRNAVVVDATGMYVTPGIIDAHSHLAADAINEGTVNVSAMVGMKDVLDPEDIGIYRALAGGVTSANILHGSANPIGGRNAVVKLRWGADAQELIFEGAPEGIKFALGENTKRDRDPDRYPSTRMGVQDVIRQAFLEAKEYMRAWDEYEQRRRRDKNAIPPRRDLKLETLAEILHGERLVHAHSYRADEILMLIRLAEEMGFKIATFQHVLEGYKVADEIAAHGAGASTFSDWWAYKVEAYDAIPYNAALMTERGVVVSINSDSDEEIRHLNQEAAKTMKWGGLSEEQALRLVTLNPAIQLGIADRTGSIDVGKDADLVVWKGHPLSTQGVPQKTYVDGKLYFDIELDRQRQDAIEREIRALMDKHLPRRREAAPVVTDEAASPATTQEGVR